jgi:hypothetical protein
MSPQPSSSGALTERSRFRHYSLTFLEPELTSCSVVGR